MKFELSLLFISTIGFSTVQGGDSCWKPSDCDTGDLTKPVAEQTGKCWATKSETINTSAS